MLLKILISDRAKVCRIPIKTDQKLKYICLRLHRYKVT